MINFHVSKLREAKFFMLCGVIFLVRLHCLTLGSERGKLGFPQFLRVISDIFTEWRC